MKQILCQKKALRPIKKIRELIGGWVNFRISMGQFHGRLLVHDTIMSQETQGRSKRIQKKNDMDVTSGKVVSRRISCLTLDCDSEVFHDTLPSFSIGHPPPSALYRRIRSSTTLAWLATSSSCWVNRLLWVSRTLLKSVNPVSY
jgi:hypothetical protein